MGMAHNKVTKPIWTHCFPIWMLGCWSLVRDLNQRVR